MDRLRTTLLCFLTLVCGTIIHPLAARSVEPSTLHADDRIWSVGYSAVDQGMEIVEYVLEGESVEDWMELITRKYFPNMQEEGTLREIMEKVRALREHRFPGVT